MEEWEIGTHELLAEREVCDESLQEFMEAVGGDFADRAGVVKTLGIYRGRKRLQPEFDKKIFVKDDPLANTQGSETHKH